VTKPLRIGIVGLGKMGKIRAETIEKNDNTVLVSATDPNPPKNGYKGVKLYPDYQAVIRSDIDAVFVCTPNRFAPDVVVAALDAGKHVFCEKPPGRNLADVERILAAERAHPDLKLKFGFNHRYHFGILEAKRIVESEQYGKILWIRGIYGKGESSAPAGEWRNDPEVAGGGILLDQGIHMLDLFRFFCGDFVEIKSMCTSAYWDVPMEDNAFALLRDGIGRVAMLHSTFNQWKHRFTLEIYMSDGYLVVDGMPSSTRSYRDEWITHARKHTGFAIGNPPEVSTFCNTDPSWDMELAEFVDCVRTGAPIRNGTSNDAYETMRMVFAIYDADETFMAQQAGKRQAAAKAALPEKSQRPRKPVKVKSKAG
jgi:predicted dehydrogenase